MAGDWVLAEFIGTDVAVALENASEVGTDYAEICVALLGFTKPVSQEIATEAAVWVQKFFDDPQVWAATYEVPDVLDNLGDLIGLDVVAVIEEHVTPGHTFPWEVQPSLRQK